MTAIEQAKTTPSMQLSESDTAVIAKVMKVSVEEVDALMARSLLDDEDALSLLWRSVYMAAVEGDSEAKRLAHVVGAWKLEMRERLKAQLPVPEKTSETPGQTVRRAAGNIAGATVTAVSALELIARRGRSESARVAAARAILDWAGLAGAERLEVTWANEQPDDNGSSQLNQLAILRARLQKIHDAKYG